MNTHFGSEFHIGERIVNAAPASVGAALARVRLDLAAFSLAGLNGYLMNLGYARMGGGGAPD